MPVMPFPHAIETTQAKRTQLSVHHRSKMAPASHSGENLQKIPSRKSEGNSASAPVHLKFNSDPYPRALSTRNGLVGGSVPGGLRVSALV